jgi:phospholipase/lecithinase/hemolysin
MSGTFSSSQFNVIYAFGDSLSDAGNAYLLTISNFATEVSTVDPALTINPEPVSPPYFQESYTGANGAFTANVFSNGSVWTQDLSQALGLGLLAPSGVGATFATVEQALSPELGASLASTAAGVLAAEAGVFVTPLDPNPYIPLIQGATVGGTDFAIGGAVTGTTGDNSALDGLSDLSAQLTTFEHDVPAPSASGLATVSIGGNDVLNMLEGANFASLYPAGTTLTNVGSTAAGADIQQSVAAENAFLGSLIATGVNHVVVMNVPDIGKTPEATSLGATDAQAGSVLADYYNGLLAADIATLNEGGAHIAIDDAFGLIDTVVANPGSFGLSNVTSPVYSGGLSSFTPGDLASSDPATQNTFLFFDQEHPTETGESGLAQLAQMVLPCFVTGTRLRTAAGMVAVEDLRVGDRMVLANGEIAPAIWIGRREVDGLDSADWPVRVRAGAFGTDRPSRDLYLSPDHAVLIGGALVPVRCLINGASIAQMPRGPVTYWHVELPRHDVLLAEGLPCESFLDTGARDPRRADFVSRIWQSEACAELVLTGPRLTITAANNLSRERERSAHSAG